MKFTVALALIVLLSSTTAHPLQPQMAAGELLVCGWDEVFALDVHTLTNGSPRRTWTWRARDRKDLPEDFKTLFNTTDECKPFDGGSGVLITSSGSGVAFVDRAQDRVRFHARVANAHSAERLPGGRFVVAASHDPAGKGDRLIVFDVAKSNQELWSEELPWGHGAVWDEQRQVLWALADADIRVYELRDWDGAAPKLRRVATIALPERGGHDLSILNGTAALVVSTANRCWLFDRDARTFRPHPELGDKAGVKSINHHPGTGQIAYVQMESPNWWAQRIHFLNPARSLHVAGEHFYKARWNVPTT